MVLDGVDETFSEAEFIGTGSEARHSPSPPKPDVVVIGRVSMSNIVRNNVRIESEGPCELLYKYPYRQKYGQANLLFNSIDSINL